MKKRNSFKIWSFLSMFLIGGCSALSAEKVPYTISGKFLMEEASSDYEICGAELEFFNWSEKAVNSFTVVFYLFDADGEPAQECWNQLTFEIEKNIQAGGKYKICLSLDSYMSSIPQGVLSIDYLYVSKICYSDGSVWDDPLGMAAFM